MPELTINTSQSVNINFIAATLVDRILACGIDLLIKAAYVIFILWVFFYGLGLATAIDSIDQFSQISVGLFFLFPVMIYSIVLESIYEGQTFGKKILKIKVVKIDGYQASFADYLIRWLFGIIEKNIMFGAIAITAMIISRKMQRIGDVAAGTAVINLKNRITINSTILEDLEDDYVPTYPLVIKLSDNDIRIIKENFIKAKSKKDFENLTKICQKIESVTGIKNQSKTEIDFLKTILKDYNFYTQNM